MAETRLRQSVDAAKVRVPLEEAYALSCQLRDPCWEAACARALAMTFSAEGNSSVALECLDVAHRSCLHETDPFVSLSVEILADKVEANKSLARMGGLGRAGLYGCPRCARRQLSCRVQCDLIYIFAVTLHSISRLSN
jgi:hypothetical protein